MLIVLAVNDTSVYMDEIEKEEKMIESELDANAENIQEVDEAANAAEGMSDRGLLDDVAEDRSVI